MITEVKQALGSWTLRLREDTPKEILDGLDPFGHIAVLPGKVDVRQLEDNILPEARYVGVYRGRANSEDITLKGAGMAFWLGDEDDKGDVFVTPVSFSEESFANTVRGLLPPGGAVTEGTIYSVPGTYTGSHQWETSRKALTYVSGVFSSEAHPVSWRVNNDGTLDAGRDEDLYVTTPRAILVKKQSGQEMFLSGLRGDLSLETDVEDYTTKVVLLAEGEGAATQTATKSLPAVPYKDLHGNPVNLTRLISESSTEASNADARAQLQLNRFSAPRHAVDLSTDEYDVKGEFQVGDTIHVFDPEAGFVDEANEVFWQGQPINPMALRVVELSYPIPSGWTVAFRRIDGSWLDLSDYYVPESGSSTVKVGSLSSVLSPPSTEPVGSRPVGDRSVPATPTFTGFSPGSYQSDSTNTTKSAIRCQWETPLNVDGSTVLDGDHFEIRYRVSAVIGYQVDWDLLTGDEAILDDFNRVTSNGWGNDWQIAAGTASSFSTNGSTARIQQTSVNNLQVALKDFGATDGFVTADIINPLGSAAGNGVTHWVIGRANDGSNYYVARLDIGTASEVNLTLQGRVGGTLTSVIDQALNIGTHVSNVPWRVVFEFRGTSLKAKAWQPSVTSEPDWQVEGTHSALTTGTFAGLGYRLEAGNTNTLPQTVSFDSFTFTDYGKNLGYSWDDLGTWDGLISDPVQASPEWQTVYVGWDSNAFTLTELTPGVTYEIQIRAVDAATPPNFSAWSASEFVTTLGDLFAPSTPAAPTVASSRIAIQVTHYLGKASGGTFNLEPDLDHLDVHVGGSDSFFCDESNKVGEMIATGGMVQSQIPAIGTFQIEQTNNVWVKVVAVDRAGNKSSASAAVQASALLIDNAHISDLSVSKLTAGTIQARTVLASEMEVGTGGNIKLTEGSLDVYDNAGRQKVEAGLLSDGDYGLALVNEAGKFVKLEDFIFGPQKAVKNSVGTTSSQSFTNLSDGEGPAVRDVAIGELGRAVITLTSYMEPESGHMCLMGVEVRRSDNNSLALAPDAFDSLSIGGGSSSEFISVAGRASVQVFVEGLAPGRYDFIAKYCVTLGTGAFANRSITVQPY